MRSPFAALLALSLGCSPTATATGPTPAGDSGPADVPDVALAADAASAEDLARLLAPGDHNGRGARLPGVNLRGANLPNADLVGANLAGADLSDAFLENANFGDANLSRVNFAGAHLSGASFYHADLSSADLSTAFVSGAGQFADAYCNAATRWPARVVAPPPCTR